MNSFFACNTGSSGLTQIIGLTQGLFTLAPGASDQIATRVATAELMLEQSTGHPVKDQTLVMNLSDLRALIAGAMQESAK